MSIKKLFRSALAGIGTASLIVASAGVPLIPVQAAVSEQTQAEINISNQAIINYIRNGKGFSLLSYVEAVNAMSYAQKPLYCLEADHYNDNSTDEPFIYDSNYREDFQYDAAGHITLTSFTHDDGSKASEIYQFDQAGYMINEIDGDKMIVDFAQVYTYNAAGQVDSLTSAVSAQIQELDFSNTYTGGSITVAYDKLGRISSYSVPTTSGAYKISFTYKNNRIVKVRETSADYSSTLAITVDPSSRKIVAATDQYTTTYHYDGGFSSVSSTTCQYSFTYNPDGTLAKSENATLSQSNTSAGASTSNGTTVYYYE